VEWLSLALGALGTLAGVGGLVIGWLGWRRSGEALDETRRTPVREAQHALLPRLSDWAKELEHLLEQRINYDVQRATDPAVLTQDVAELTSLVQQITEPVVVDEELDIQLQRLRSIVTPQGVDTGGLAVSLESFSKLTGQVAQAKSGAADVDELLALGGQHGRSIEPIRRMNEEALEAVKAIQARLRLLARHGLGKLPSASQLGTDRKKAIGSN
jgi:hypothetical protein